MYALTNHEVICISVLQGEVGYTVGMTYKIKVKSDGAFEGPTAVFPLKNSKYDT